MTGYDRHAHCHQRSVPFAAGDRVAVRGDRYVVDEAVAFTDCTVLSLSPADPTHNNRTCKLLLPFDRPTKSTNLPKVHVFRRRRWMRHLHTVLADLRVSGELRAAPRASIDVLPFQLEPALALISGRASRFLLADEVGLGKTIQAGLMIAELQQRGWCERALIVTPAGLRRQWADELNRRFGVQAVVIDAAALLSLTNSLPHDVNPWTTEPVFITSIDFIKQAEVLRGLCLQPWDILIVDEAHQASAASLRYDAVKRLAGRSRHVVLLTATPHAGDDASYRTLCDLGRVDCSDRILLFRRTRQQAGRRRTRRVHLLPVRLSPEAMEMHHALAAYVARLWRIAQETGRRDLQLVAMVLSKRAFSSARSLAASIERRLAAISGLMQITSQCGLPFDADTDSADEAPHPVAPAFDRHNEEETALRRLLAAATRAHVDDRKARVLRKLLQRVREPIIVFTEYRDTLDALESAIGDLRTPTKLHGGQTPQQRHNAVEAFKGGAADLLLATDAGAEGLNLQSRCRLVINLELPWSPTRLEQRIGRVDRIGQRHTVHAINLFAEGTAESAVLAGLLRRVERIHASEIEIAASVISSAPLPARQAADAVDGVAETVDLSAEARKEASRITTARCIAPARLTLDDAIIPVTFVSSSVLKTYDHRLKSSIIWFVRIRIVNRLGRLVEDRLVALAAGEPVITRKRREVRAITQHMIDVFGPAVVQFASKLGEERAQVISHRLKQWLPRTARREEWLAQTAASGFSSEVQPGLFDKRSVKQQQLAEQQRRNILTDCAERTASLEADTAAAVANTPQIALLLVT